MIIKTRTATTKAYQAFQLLNNGGASSLFSISIHYLFVRRLFKNTMMRPITRPSIKPSLTFFINVPTTSPITMATRKDISPRRISIKGFLLLLITHQSLFIPIKLAISLNAPGTAAGNCLKKTNPV